MNRIHPSKKTWRNLAILACIVLAGGAMAPELMRLNQTATSRLGRDPLSILAKRSPGARGYGDAVDTKHARVNLLTPILPTPKGRHVIPTLHKPEHPDPGLVPGDGRALVVGPQLQNIGPPVLVVPPTLLPPDEPPPPVLPPVIPPVEPPVLPPIQPPPPPVPVPEPAAWAIFILGFAMVGAALRRQRTIARSWL